MVVAVALRPLVRNNTLPLMPEGHRVKDPATVAIYHLTHINNLPSILGTGGLGCTSQLDRRGFARTNIAYDSIQSTRSRTSVPCGPGGGLHDYVPLFFAPRSPMLFTVKNGNVPAYRGGQESLIHLMTTVATVITAGRPFVFTDGHATMQPTCFYDDISDLDEVNWGVMASTTWYDTPALPDRKRRRQAEFLVHTHLPWRLIREVGVYSAAMQQKVLDLIADQRHKPAVTVRREWYY